MELEWVRIASLEPGRLRRFSPELVSHRKVEVETSVTLRPKNGIWMRMKRRPAHADAA